MKYANISATIQCTIIMYHQYAYPGGTMRVPSPSDRIYACARQFTMNLRYAFNNCAFARVRTYVLSTQLGVLRNQLRVLSVRKCADFHENRLIYAYLSTRVCV